MTPASSVAPDAKYKYVFGLLGNARAFVESAVEYARQDYREQWKFAILHLNTALELLLKARLALEDHRQIAAGKSAVTDRQFDEGEFRSVTIEECMDRLAKTGKFALDARQRQAIRALQHLRNRIAHYIDHGDIAAMKAVVAAGLNVFIDVNNAEFQGEDPYGARTMPQLVVDLHKYRDFVEERLSSLSGRLASATRPRTRYTDECSFCLQDATIIERDAVTCLFCGHGMDVREFAEMKSDDGTVTICPDCARESVARHQRKDSAPTHECFVCGYFTGPELKWSDGKAVIPRLHADR